MMRKLTSTYTALIAALLLLPVLAGCTPAASTAAAFEQPAATSEQPDVTSEPVFTGGSGTFHLTDPAVGLDTLVTWSATLVFSMEDADGSRSETLQVARTDNLLYQRVPGDETCSITQVPTEAPIDPDTGLMLISPAALRLPAVIGATEAGSDHYTFDRTALGMHGINTAAGEIWIDPTSGVVLQYHLTVEAGADFFGEGNTGTLIWDYTLRTDVSTMPEGCTPIMADVPLMADAQNVERMQGSLVFTSPSDVLSGAAFYQQHFDAAGWEALEEPVVDERLVLLSYHKEGQMLTIRIEPSDAGSLLQIILREPEG
jgi:hypothetical protein